MNYHAVQLAESAMVSPSACLVGDVEIGVDVTVMHAVSARGDYGGRVIVGARSNLQENVCIHVDRDGLCQVGEGVTVGHGAILHGCTIGDGCVVGMGSCIIDGARVGAHCLIGAGALVTGTADIPEGSLVLGSPARAVRALAAEEIARITEAADEYLAIGHDMTAQGLLFSGLDAVRAHCPQVALA